MYVLDTNIVSELRKTGRRPADGRVLAWVAGIEGTAMFVSAITILEVQQGVLSIARRDPAQGARLQAWIQAIVLPSFGNRILPVDTKVALRCATLHVPDPRPERDALIAATALVHGMTVVTRNVVDFTPMGVPVINPWGTDRASR